MRLTLALVSFRGLLYTTLNRAEGTVPVKLVPNMASGLLAFALATASQVASAQSDLVPTEGPARWDRCAFASAAIRMISRPTRHMGSDGFDARVCRPEIASDGAGERFGIARALQGIAGFNFLTRGRDLPVQEPYLIVSLDGLPRDLHVIASYAHDVERVLPADVVSSASRRAYVERDSATIEASMRLGPARVSVDGAIALADSFRMWSAGAAAALALPGVRVEPILAYHVGGDMLFPLPSDGGYLREPLTHTIDAGVHVPLSARTTLTFLATLAFVQGDMSNPRMGSLLFYKEDAARLGRGAPIEEAYPLARGVISEQLPASRERLALTERILHRFGTATLRIDERLYIDTWGMKASTTDARFWQDIKGVLRLGPHLRLHAQTGTDFWLRAVSLRSTPHGDFVPIHRTSETALSPLVAITGGAHARWLVYAPSDPSAPEPSTLAINLLAEGSHTELLDTLFVTHGWSFFGAVSVEAQWR